MNYRISHRLHTYTPVHTWNGEPVLSLFPEAYSKIQQNEHLPSINKIRWYTCQCNTKLKNI